MVNTQLDTILMKISKAKTDKRDLIIVPATIQKDTIRKLLENGYRVILSDSFDGSSNILITWNDNYEPSSYWDVEYSLDSLI